MLQVIFFIKKSQMKWEDECLQQQWHGECQKHCHVVYITKLTIEKKMLQLQQKCECSTISKN
jgi:hypothetical protein